MRPGVFKRLNRRIQRTITAVHDKPEASFGPVNSSRSSASSSARGSTRLATCGKRKNQNRYHTTDGMKCLHPALTSIIDDIGLLGVWRTTQSLIPQRLGLSMLQAEQRFGVVSVRWTATEEGNVALEVELCKNSKHVLKSNSKSCSSGGKRRDEVRHYRMPPITITFFIERAIVGRSAG